MEYKPKKVIQKRVALREKMARLARKRHRKEKNIFYAKVQDLDLPPKYKSQSRVYQSLLGMTILENEDGVIYDPCGYFSNSVQVQNDDDDDNKVLLVKLHKNDQYEVNELNDEVLDEWEARDDPYWGEWVRNHKEARKQYNCFIDKCKDKFEAIKLDNESLKVQKTFVTKRQELMSKKASIEFKFRFDSQGNTSTEIAVNSRFINNLNYDFEEFIQKTLVEGMPELGPNYKQGSHNLSTLVIYLEHLFNNALEANVPDSIFFAKNMNHKKVDLNITIGGYFVKNAAELSTILSINGSELLLEGETVTKPIYRLYLEQQMTKEAEKRYFLEMYYKDYVSQIMFRPKETCQIRACITMPEDEFEDEIDEDSIERMKLEEEFIVKDNGESYNNSIKEELYELIPSTDYSPDLMSQLEIMKTICHAQQRMLDQFALIEDC